MEPSVMFGTVGAVLSIGGVVVWAVRTEGRVNTHDALFVERAKQDTLRADSLTQRLDRIEHKIDAYFNSHNGTLK